MKIKRADVERILILCAAVLVVVLALTSGTTTTTTMVGEGDISVTSAQPAGETVATVVYYADGDGYLVPVTRQIEKTDGIAKATLALMVQSGQNDMEAARLGLRTVVPEGTTFELDIADGKARVDMSAEALNCASLEAEQAMVEAVASTLCCFSTVDEVSFLFDGQRRSKLTHGTEVSGAFTGDTANLEPVAASGEYDTVQLYFPSQTGRLLVPVTRPVFSVADPTTAMVELARGPQADSGLERALPENCGIRSVTMKNGVVTVDLTREFTDALQASDGGKQTIRAILFTCGQFPGVSQVRMLVEGQPIDKQPDAAATFLNDEEEVMAQYPGVIELD